MLLTVTFPLAVVAYFMMLRVIQNNNSCSYKIVNGTEGILIFTIAEGSYYVLLYFVEATQIIGTSKKKCQTKQSVVQSQLN